MRKLAAFVSAIILTFSTLAGGQGASEEYQAHCRDLQDRMVTAKTRMVKGVLPQEDPSRFLSSMSCLDSILKMQFNFGVFFNIDWVIGRFMEMITNRICSNAGARWDSMVSWVNDSVGVNVEMPWGVRNTSGTPSTPYGPPAGPRLPFFECTAQDIAQAAALEVPLQDYPRDWKEKFVRMNAPPYWVAGARGIDPATGYERYPSYSYSRVRGYQLHGDIFSVKFTTLRDTDMMFEVLNSEIPGTDDGMPTAHWISECPRGAPVTKSPQGIPVTCISQGTGVFNSLVAFTRQPNGSDVCLLDRGKTYYMNFTHADKFGAFTQPASLPPPTPEGWIFVPTATNYEWRIWWCDAQGGCHWGPTAPPPITETSCAPSASANPNYDEFTFQGQKIVRRLPRGVIWAVKFTTRAQESYTFETTETLQTPSDADHMVAISECPGDFSKLQECGFQATNKGSSLQGGTIVPPPGWMRCRLKPNTTYYMNVKQVDRFYPNIWTCNLQEGCDIRVRLLYSQVDTSCKAAPNPVIPFTVPASVQSTQIALEATEVATASAPMGPQVINSITVTPTPGTKTATVSLWPCPGQINLFCHASSPGPGQPAVLKYVTGPVGTIRNQTDAMAAGYCWAPPSASGAQIDQFVNVSAAANVLGQKGTVDLVWKNGQ